MPLHLSDLRDQLGPEVLADRRDPATPEVPKGRWNQRDQQDQWVRTGHQRDQMVQQAQRDLGVLTGQPDPWGQSDQAHHLQFHWSPPDLVDLVLPADLVGLVLPADLAVLAVLAVLADLANLADLALPSDRAPRCHLWGLEVQVGQLDPAHRSFQPDLADLQYLVVPDFPLGLAVPSDPRLLGSLEDLALLADLVIRVILDWQTFRLSQKHLEPRGFP